MPYSEDTEAYKQEQVALLALQREQEAAASALAAQRAQQGAASRQAARQGMAVNYARGIPVVNPIVGTAAAGRPIVQREGLFGLRASPWAAATQHVGYDPITGHTSVTTLTGEPSPYPHVLQGGPSPIGNWVWPALGALAPQTFAPQNIQSAPAKLKKQGGGGGGGGAPAAKTPETKQRPPVQQGPLVWDRASQFDVDQLETLHKRIEWLEGLEKDGKLDAYHAQMLRNTRNMLAAYDRTHNRGAVSDLRAPGTNENKIDSGGVDVPTRGYYESMNDWVARNYGRDVVAGGDSASKAGGNLADKIYTDVTGQTISPHWMAASGLTDDLPGTTPGANPYNPTQPNPFTGVVPGTMLPPDTSAGYGPPPYGVPGAPAAPASGTTPVGNPNAVPAAPAAPAAPASIPVEIPGSGMTIDVGPRAQQIKQQRSDAAYNITLRLLSQNGKLTPGRRADLLNRLRNLLGASAPDPEIWSRISEYCMSVGIDPQSLYLNLGYARQ